MLDSLWKLCESFSALAEIICTNGTRIRIDDCDAHLAAFRWTHVRRSRAEYAKRDTRFPRRTLYLHREIMQPPSRYVVDHINGDGLDCRRSNMRVASRAENNRNATRKAKGKTSRFKGVSWVSRRNHWIAQIVANGRYRYLGSFQTQQAAQDAYAAASERLHGDFAAPRVSI